MVLDHVFVAVPVDAWIAERPAREKLNESNAAFEQPARQQTAASELRGFGTIETVERLRGLRLLAKDGNFGDRELHSRRQLVTANPCGKRVVAGTLDEVLLIERRDEVARRPVRVGWHGASGKQIVDRRPLTAHGDALMTRGEKAVGPVNAAAGGEAARVGDYDKRGKVVGLTSHAVGQPGAERRETVEAEPGVLLKRRRRVVRCFRDHRIDDR